MIEGQSSRPAWPVPELFPAPPVSRLHVWRIELSHADPVAAEALLDREERARAARLRSQAVRRRFTTARAALRQILGEYSGVTPRVVAFSYADAGKPHLADPNGVAFNLSHSADLALCAVTGSGKVGVDIEEIRPLRDVERLVQRHFSGPERAGWLDLAPSDRLEGFYRVWTRKEAMLKAAGVGLARPLERVDSLTGALDDAVYWVTGLDPGPGFTAAVATGSAPGTIDRWSWGEP